MNDRANTEGEVRAALEAKDQRMRDLERRLAEAETNLQAVILQQIDAVITPEKTIPLLLHQAQQALQRSNEELELRVAQRTAELTKELDERMRAEQALRNSQEALRDSEEKFRIAFTNAAIGFALSTADGRFVDANPAFCTLTGYSIEELRHYAFYQILHPDDSEENLDLFNQMHAGKISNFIIENRYVRKDGQVVWVRKSVSPVHDEDGRPKWHIVLVEDITERKRAEKALRESEQLYRAIGESIDYGVWICEPDGRNIYASPSFLDLLGITQQQCSDFGWGDSLNPEEAERTIAAWKECVRTESVWDREHHFLGRDGQYHAILARGMPVRNEQREIICWAGINLDISHLKQMEQARLQDQVQIELQRQLMAQREQERQQIARDIHDGPIQTLVSTTFNLQITKEAVGRAIANQPLQIELNQIGLSIKTAIQELREVVNALRPPSLLRFGLTQAIRIHAEDLQEKHPELEIHLDMPQGSIQMPEQTTLTLFRIYQEALNNVIRHAEATRVIVRLTCEEAQALLEIEDNGKGFVPISDLTGQTAKGHYGLSGMKERAEAVRGVLQIQTLPGKGTTIQVRVPIVING